MQIDYLRRLVVEFRLKIDKGIENNCFDEDKFFSRFPYGCCGDASDLLAEFLLDNGISSKYINGTAYFDDPYNTQSHSWLEIENTIVDITIDQFKNNALFNDRMEIKKYYCGEKNSFYDMFDVNERDCRKYEGLDRLGTASERLKQLYQKIISINIDWRNIDALL